MQENSLERKLVSELERHHDHASNPEEEDIMSSLKQVSWEESLVVLSLLVWPAHGGHWEDAG